MRALKYAAIGIAALLVLAVAAAVVVSLAVDPNRYKPEIVRLVKERTGRTLTIDGRITLTFFPRLGLAVEKAALSGPGGSGKFASVTEARVAIALLPLLARRVVVDRIELAGLDAELVRRKDGSTNFDDLLGEDTKPAAGAPGKEPSAPSAPSAPALEIGGVALRDASIVWRDEGKAQTVKLAGLDLRTGRIAEGARGRLEVATRIQGSGPPLDLAVKGSADYRLELARGAFALEDLDLKVDGDAPGAAGLAARAQGDLELDPARERFSVARLVLAATTRDGLELKASVPKLRIAPEGAAGDAASAELKLARPARTVIARVALSPLAAKGGEIRFERLAVDAEVRQGEATFATRVASPLTIDFGAKTARLAPLAGELVASGPHLPQKSVKGSVVGGARVAWGKPSSAAADLVAKLEDATLEATLAVANLDAPAFDFDLAADRLDVDRYLPPTRPAAGAGGAASGKPPQPTTRGSTSRSSSRSTARRACASARSRCAM
ncbi:MAG: AsmA family protein [Burkholderiales bacterium]|nr:AsmA family protein [Burkholderiales bacterium]